MVTSARGEDVIREAVARALFDCPPDLLDSLKKQWGKGQAAALAQRIAKELQTAGWEMKSCRDKRMTLEDEIAFAVDFATSKSVLAELGSENRGKANWARGALTAKIQETFNLAKVVLRKRKRT